MLAYAHGLAPLFVILALVAFGVAIWLVVRAAYIAAIVAAVIGVLILLYS